MTTTTLIIGAGISGIATAAALESGGHSCTILEGRDRLGGRLESIDLGGRPGDLGATWFWPGEHRVAALVERLDIEVHEQWLAGDAMAEPAGRPPYRFSGNPLDVTSYRFADGAQGLAEALASTLSSPIHLGTRAMSITATSTGISAVADGETITADRVVLALPPSLGASLLDPTLLTDEARGIAEAVPVWMGGIAKAVITFERPFWRDSGLSGSAASHVGPLHEVHDMSGPNGQPARLFGFAQTANAGEVTVESVTTQLHRLFGTDMPAPTSVSLRDWSTEPLTVSPDAAATDRYDLYGSAVLHGDHGDGRVYFTSTETATNAPGHIEGALAAAERTAAAILG